MKEILPNLFCLTPSNGEQTAPTYFIIRPEGNLLLGAGGGASEYYQQISQLGPILKVLIGDRHHAKSYSPAAEYFKAPLCCSKEEAKVIRKKGVAIDEIINYERHHLYEDLEVIPTPGHTVGALSYGWESANNKVLFIGDTIVPVDGEWKVWVTKKNKQTMLETMDLLNRLEFNYIAIGSGAVTGNPVIELDKKSKNAMIESIVNSVSAL